MSWHMDGPIRDEDGFEVITITARQAAALHRPLARVLDLVDSRDGGTLHPLLRELRAQVAAAAAEFRAAEGLRAQPHAQPLEQDERGRATPGEDDLCTLIDVNAAATIIGCTPSRVRTLIAERVLSSSPNDRGHHQLDLDEVEAYRDHRSRQRTESIS